MSAQINSHSNTDTIADFLTVSDRRNSEKRRDYLEWDEYFMAVTFLELNKSPNKHKSDAALVLNHRQIIVSIAHGIRLGGSNDDKKNHAEYRALADITGGVTMYTTSFPCVDCAEAIAAAGISEIIYCQDSNNREAKDLLSRRGVSYRQFVSKKGKIEIDFCEYYDESS